jgi:hypothetical protein
MDAFAWLAAVLDSLFLGQRATLERNRPGSNGHIAPAEIRQIGAGLHLLYFLQYFLQFLWGDEERGANYTKRFVLSVTS